MRHASRYIGAPLSALPTPALVIHMPSLEKNDLALRSLLPPSPNKVRLRPHAKALKSAAFANWLLTRAAAPNHATVTSLCAQTLTEAEVMIKRAHCDDLLLTNAVPPTGISRLVKLAADHSRATIGVLVDSVSSADALGEACAAAGAKLHAWVEIDCGQDRCGVRPDSLDAVAIARAVCESRGLVFGGLHVYHGAIQHTRPREARARAVRDGPVAAATRVVADLAAAGIQVPQVTGGGTGTLLQDLENPTHTELQPGSYLVMDADYARVYEEEERLDLEQALFVHTSVLTAAGDKRVVDAGAKAVDLVSGVPLLAPYALDGQRRSVAPSTAVYSSGGDEHGVLRGVAAGELAAGETALLVPRHCDPTVNLHSRFYCLRDGRVEDVWPIDARGWTPLDEDEG